ncbi:hypothetical protein J1N35_004871 [Gossypium stocksii]|uniref:Sugar phosphate transporter domain-containing protein n=1 Tax=Gossypium stocksii TaxID=47602 RepID=A0A9D3WD16_9ROSI|nr:hypothetical protein J1N35_004871 [Gossypium stocksii]
MVGIAKKTTSTTTFTMTGVMNKFLTVVINVLIWDKRATLFELVCLLFTLAGGVLYQQSATGQPHELSASKQTNDVDENDANENQDKSVSGKHASV